MKDINNETTGVQIHHGENVRFFRDVMLGWSQEYFASQMNIHQSDVSKLENQEVINDDKLKQIAKIFGIDENALKCRNLRNEAKTYIFEIQGDYNVSKIVNPLEKISDLYERWLAEKNERIQTLEKEIQELKKK